ARTSKRSFLNLESSASARAEKVRYARAEDEFCRALKSRTGETPVVHEPRSSPRCAKQVEILWLQRVDRGPAELVTLEGFEDRQGRTCVPLLWTENAPLRRRLRDPQQAWFWLDGVLQ